MPRCGAQRSSCGGDAFADSLDGWPGRGCRGGYEGRAAVLGARARAERGGRGVVSRRPRTEHELRSGAAEWKTQGGSAEDVPAQRWRLLALRRAVQAGTSAQRGDLHAHAVGDLRRPTRYFVSSPQTTHGRGSLCSLARSPLVPGSISARLIRGDLVECDDGEL